MCPNAGQLPHSGAVLCTAVPDGKTFMKVPSSRPGRPHELRVWEAPIHPCFLGLKEDIALRGARSGQKPQRSQARSQQELETA